jgi:hypothetical protein
MVISKNIRYSLIYNMTSQVIFLSNMGKSILY